MSEHVAKVRNRSLTAVNVKFSWQHSVGCMLYGSVNVYCNLSIACSVDTTRLMQLITVGCLVMREVDSAAVWVVILCLRKSVPRAVSVVFLSHYVTSICVTTSC